MALSWICGQVGDKVRQDIKRKEAASHDTSNMRLIIQLLPSTSANVSEVPSAATEQSGRASRRTTRLLVGSRVRHTESSPGHEGVPL